MKISRNKILENVPLEIVFHQPLPFSTENKITVAEKANIDNASSRDVCDRTL